MTISDNRLRNTGLDRTPKTFPCNVAERLVRETWIGRAGVRALALKVRADLHGNIVLVRKISANHTTGEAETIKVMALAFVAAAKAKMI